VTDTINLSGLLPLLSEQIQFQQLARELCFVFAGVPASEHVAHDFQRVWLDRGMEHYADGLAWARLIAEREYIGQGRP